MVFESLVADLLNKYLGEYVENLDKSQLNIGIWGGDVALRDLTLKENALEDLNLPVKTVRGHLGQLTLQIPWKNLYGAPVIATIERLFLLVVPNQSVRYDKEKEEKWAEEAKQAELLKIEEAKKALREKDKPKPDNTFVEKLAAQIIKNVQVRIKNIHIRYEDKVTNPEKPFALGITLNSLDVVTIPSWGEPLSIDPVNIIFKELSIQCLSVYWNSCTTLFSDFSTENYLIAISDGIATKSTMPPGYKYRPINSSSKLRINTKPEMDGSNFKIPKVLLQLDLERLQVKISKSQYQDLTVLLETMSRMSRAAQYRKFRPDVSSYRGHYKEWWIFAYKCILEEEVKRRKQNWDWFHMLNHRLLCKKYAETYKGKLISPKPSSEIIDKCTQLERELDILNIVLVRQKVELEVMAILKVIVSLIAVHY
ncbi:hypothetical protein AAG570_000289 [Ranatra chinensis]|uniref:Chorein N-terminal domain-containing protein n=1 Tax=Ranatra chinensis TaxID=642074 RepID=A0ABD0YWP1_9HEMI